MSKKTWRNEQNLNAMSGSELMMTELEKRLGKELDDFQIILSRPSLHELDETKIRLLWCHDLDGDPQIADPNLANTLANQGWKRYHRIVFVSHWQQQKFIERFQIPWERTVVMKNAINPIEIDLAQKFKSRKPDDVVNICYTTTPHRGLGILVPVFHHLAEQDKNIHLHVFSSFKIYGWEERDKQFDPLYDAIKDHPQMTYHGTVPNEQLKNELKNMDIHAYPSTWLETSCISLIEAMSAGLLCIHPNRGALYETSSNWTFMYNYFDDNQQHMGFFLHMLDQVIKIFRNLDQDEGMQIKLQGQKSFADLFYNWDVREQEWRNFLNAVRDLPREIETPNRETFSYKVG